jgi:predicted metal-dependent HD superfamily phosphohydrolase
VSVLIDPPLWPAHGRTWSHLVSDSSLHELRLFARGAGVPDRAFDVDHYDVPADRYDELVAAGAEAVDGGTLTRRLAASGLRVAGRERARAKPPALRARWARLWPHDSAPDRPTHAVGDELIERWGEPHRVYHSRLHLADTLDALDTLVATELSGRSSGRPAPRPDSSARRLAALALWFHDAVHDGVTPDDEERSAALARTLLRDLPGAEEVARLVLVTADHDPDTDDHAGSLVSDADLAILGASPALYARYTSQVRVEYGHVPDADFRAGRAAVLAPLLDLHRRRGLFRTPQARARWADQAEHNLRTELAALENG